jgi:hypothetical protein
MSGLFGGGGVKSPAPPPPIPQIDNAIAARNAENQTLMQRGRATTVLTSDTGLPNLGSTSAPSAGGKKS